MVDFCGFHVGKNFPFVTFGLRFFVVGGPGCQVGSKHQDEWNQLVRPRQKSTEKWGFHDNLLGCPVGFVRINGDRISGLFHLLINGIYWGYNPLPNRRVVSP